jgi:short-subunit dehydrogenase
VSINLKDVRDQVIVITGASSGIGLTTARIAARRGARVVVAARSRDALQRLEEEIRSAGGKAAAVEADVTRLEDVRRIASAAVRRFGGFDTWVNNAGCGIYGQITRVPVEDERRLFELNYWGVVYGCRVAVDHLRKRGGAIINIGSVASDRAVPLQAAYSASKHAVKAFTDALRLELEKDGLPVSVTLIKPAAIDTPFFRHALSYLDAQPTEPPPLYMPEIVANAILHAAAHPVRDVLVGDTAPLQSFMGRVVPRLGDRYSKAVMFEGQKSRRRRESGENRGLDRPSGDLREHGEYDTLIIKRSAYTSARLHPFRSGALAVGAGAALAAAAIAMRKQGRAKHFPIEE